MRTPYIALLISVLCMSAVVALCGCRQPDPLPERHPSAYVLETLSLELLASRWESVEAQLDRHISEALARGDQQITRHPPLELALGHERAVDRRRALRDQALRTANAASVEQKVGLLIKATLKAVDPGRAMLDMSFHDSKVIGWGEDANGFRVPEISLESWETSLEVPMDRWQVVGGLTSSGRAIRQIVRVNSRFSK